LSIEDDSSNVFMIGNEGEARGEDFFSLLNETRTSVAVSFISSRSGLSSYVFELDTTPLSR